MTQVTRLTCEYRSEHLGIDTNVPRFSWWMEDGRPGASQSAYQIQVATDPAFGARALVWDSGEVERADAVLVPYAGADLQSRTRYSYRVRIRDLEHEWSTWTSDWFETAFLDQSEWTASWIVPTDESATATPSDDDVTCAPYMRRVFTLSAAPTSARLYVAARGLVEISVNGTRVGNDRFVPGWTDFNARCQYVCYDVSALLVDGENAIGAVLGDGWYSGRIARIRDGERAFGSRPQLLCELHVTGSGGEFSVATDAEWQWRGGPILASDIYDGESYDRGAELAGWDRPGTLDGWLPVRVVGPADARWDGTIGKLAPRLDAKVVPPVRGVEELAPVAQTEPEPGRYVYDFGQNFAGWVRLTARGIAGGAVTMRFAEMLNNDGTLYVENLRSAKATDTIACPDDDTFTWEPHFTFHGFRYVEVSGVAAAPAPADVTGVVLHNDLTRTGTFECSSELVNQLQHNIEWGQRSNYLEAPTDCPQRDERLGWTGDAQVFIPTASFNMNVASFFTKWQRDLVDSQGASGSIPSVAPAMRYMTQVEENDGGPAWSDAFVICPWTIRTRFGDTRIIADHYDAMRRFVDSLSARSRGLIRSDRFVTDWGGYGDWVSMDAPAGSPIGATPTDLIGTAYFAYSTDLLRRMAELLGKQREAVDLRDLHRRIVRAFQDEYVTTSGRLLGDTQTSYLVALAFDLLPPETRQTAVDRLVRLLEQRNWRLATGFVGTPLLCPVLTRFGRADVAYRLLLQEEFPSWLYTVKQGATTMWERWNSYTHEHGFGPVEMNSFNHYAYGSIGDWIYSTVAGLRVDMSDPAEAPIRVEPIPGHGLTSARARLETPFGFAESSWKINDDAVSLEVLVPANSWARVVIPAGLSDVEIDADEGEAHLEDLVVHESSDGGLLRFRVAAGAYRFGWALP